MQTFYRHWDVLIVRIDSIPEWIDLKQQRWVVLVEGETTGHAHRLKTDLMVKIFEDVNRENNYLRWFMKITEPSDLTHEEHDTITLPIGDYAVYVQREYDPQEERRVLD